MPEDKQRKYRSSAWFSKLDKDGFIHRSWVGRGFPEGIFDGRPIIGICNTWSELTPCNGHFRELAEHVKRGVWEAGGLPFEFPVMSLGETSVRPTAMRLLPASLRRLEPQTPRIAKRFSNALIAPHEQPVGPARYRVAMLTGCVQDLTFPDVNRDTVDVLLANGCAVDTPSSQPCCGSLHAHNGDVRRARTLARRMIDLFPPDRYDAIISNAGGCGSHLRHYGPLLAHDVAYRDTATLWDTRVRDVQEWLMEIGCRPPKASPFSEPTTITYHESCHLVHGQKIARQPRALLKLLPGVSFVELPESSWCCGAAGIYAITQPEQAERLLGRKAANIIGTGARWVATANPGCQLQVARGLDATGADINVAHPMSLLARAYRREQGASAQ